MSIKQCSESMAQYVTGINTQLELCADRMTFYTYT